MATAVHADAARRRVGPAALAFVLFVVILVATLLQFRLQRGAAR